MQGRRSGFKSGGGDGGQFYIYIYVCIIYIHIYMSRMDAERAVTVNNLYCT